MNTSFRLAATLVAAGCTALVVGIAPSGATHASTSVTYQDSTGEDARALDISTVTVSNDDAGLVTFDVKLANRSPDAARDYVFAMLDTDSNASTGDPDTGGCEWGIAWKGEPVLFQWNGSEMTLAPSMTTLAASPGPNELVLKVNRSELGNTTGFNFYLKTYQPDASDPEGEWADYAPSFGSWHYDVKLYVAPRLTAKPLQFVPATPKAGKPLLTRTVVTVTRGGTPEQLAPSTIIKATATVAGKKLVGAVTPTYATGTIAIRWLVPKTAKGKWLRGRVTITLEKVTITVPIAKKVA